MGSSSSTDDEKFRLINSSGLFKQQRQKPVIIPKKTDMSACGTHFMQKFPFQGNYLVIIHTTCSGFAKIISCNQIFSHPCTHEWCSESSPCPICGK